MKKISVNKVIKMSLLKDCICFRTNFKGDWFIFFDRFGEPFYDIDIAIKYFRENHQFYKDKFKAYYFEICEFEQARIGGGGWDNA